MGKYGFGVDLGGTTIKLACFDGSAKLLYKWEIPTRRENAGKEILPDISAAILGYLKNKNIPIGDVLGIGLGVPGPVTPDGWVNKCINLGWGILPVAEKLSALTGLPVKAGNDANLAALGEYRAFGGEGCKSMVFATLGTGVGGGIVIDGKLLSGFHGAGGEIGHITLNRNETETCSCGNRGCAEQYCSATGIVRLAKTALSQSQDPSCLREIKNLSCKDIFAGAQEQDGLCLEILEQAYAYMGQFLASVCNVVDPEIVVLGGGVSNAGAPLLEEVKRHFKNYVFHAVSPVRFALAKLGNDAGVYGAFYLLLNEE